MRLRWDFHELYDFGERIGNIAEFERVCEEATRELAKVFQDMLIKETPLVTGQLAAGWGGAKNCSYTVKRLKNGFKVELVNEVPYAKYVNDGHYSYNQYNVGGEPYVVHNRIKVPTRSEHDTLSVDASRYVFGHFFVEKSIAKLEGGRQLNKVLYEELEKWFRGCVNGK